MGGAISADESKQIEPVSGLAEVQFARLVVLVRRRGGDVQRGRPWRLRRLPLEDRVLVVATYWRTNLTLRQVASLFGSQSPWPTASLIASHPCWRSRRRAGHVRTPSTSSTAPWAHPRPQHRRLQRELPLLDHTAGRHRRQQQPGRGDREPAARQPQRLPGLHGVRRRPGLPRSPGHRRRRLPGHRPAHPTPQTTCPDASQPVAGSGEHHPSPGPSPGRTRSAPAEELEDPARLPPQRQRRAPGNARYRPTAQPGPHRKTHTPHGTTSNHAPPRHVALLGLG